MEDGVAALATTPSYRPPIWIKHHMKRAEIVNWFDKNAKYVLTLPAVVFVLLMVGFPLIYTIILSMMEWNLTTRGGASWNNFQNYIELLSSERFWKATGRTFMFSFGSVILQVILGGGIALYLHKKFYGKNLIKTLLLLPMITTPVAIAMVWLLIFEPNIGLVNHILGILGIEPMMWLASSKTVMGSLIIIEVWQQTPLIMLITLAGLSSLPSEPFESALIDGASKLQIFSYITVPLVLPYVFIGFLIRIIDASKNYDLIYATTQGGPGLSSETLNIYGFVLGFHYFRMGLGSAMIILFLVFLSLVGFILVKARKRLIFD